MKLDNEQIRKLNLFSYDPYFYTKSKEIIFDFIYSSRACSIIYLSSMELEILLSYSSNNISKKKISKLIVDLSNKYNFVLDFDSFLFFSKLIKDAYKFSDGIILNKNHLFKQKKIYLLHRRYQEILSYDLFYNYHDLIPIMENKKAIYIYFKNEKHSILPFENTIYCEIDSNEISKHSSIFEWFDILKMRIMIQEFDVAFVNLGIFSNLLNYFISQTLHKIAISEGVEDND